MPFAINGEEEEEFPGQWAGCDGWGPCDCGHTRTRTEYAEPDPEPTRYPDPEPRRLTPFWNASCRYNNRRAYRTEAAARSGANEIEAQVTFRGGDYVPLEPYPCPYEQHWHLRWAAHANLYTPRGQ